MTLQEHVHQYFEDALPYPEFSMVLRIADMPQLLEILESITSEEIQEKRRKM